MLPGLQIFLDVDDLVEGTGAEAVDRSALVLVFAKSPYFERRNCVREVVRAVAKRRPIVTLLEPDQHKGRMSKAEIHAALVLVAELFATPEAPSTIAIPGDATGAPAALTLSQPPPAEVKQQYEREIIQRILGDRGATIRSMREQSGAQIKVSNDKVPGTNAQVRRRCALDSSWGTWQQQ